MNLKAEVRDTGRGKDRCLFDRPIPKNGVEPGNPDGTFLQTVPLVGFQAKRVVGSFQSGGHTIGLNFPND